MPDLTLSLMAIFIVPIITTKWENPPFHKRLLPTVYCYLKLSLMAILIVPIITEKKWENPPFHKLLLLTV